MERYKNGKIYKIVNDVDDRIYVGSTCKRLSQRFNYHKQCAKKRPNTNVYRHLNNVGWVNAHIILIENYPCDSKEELLKRERHWYDVLKPELNKNRPFATSDEIRERNREYREANKDKILEQEREYYEANKDKVSEYKREYYESNKDKVRKKHLEYYEANKDKIREQVREYYEAYKDRVLEHKRTPWTCECCNVTVKLSSKSQHLKSKTHQQNSTNS